MTFPLTPPVIVLALSPADSNARTATAPPINLSDLECRPFLPRRLTQLRRIASITGSARKPPAFRSHAATQAQRQAPKSLCHYPHSAEFPAASFNPASVRSRSTPPLRTQCPATSQHPQDSMCCSVGFDNCALAAQRRVLQHIDRIEIPQRSEPLTRSSSMRYAATGTLAGAADAIRSIETTRGHRADRRRGCDMAIVGASAEQSAEYRLFGLRFAVSPGGLDRCLCAAYARARLDRGRDLRGRDSLGGRAQRTVRRNRG